VWNQVTATQHETMCRAWDRADEAYLKKMLINAPKVSDIKKKMLLARKGQKGRNDQEEYEEAQEDTINSTTAVADEMKNSIKSASRQWVRLNNRMNGDLNRLKDNGTLLQGTKADLVAKLLVPAEKRRRIVSEMMIETRKAFFAAQKALFAQAVQDRCYFNPNEASMMLKEDGEKLERLVNNKINKGGGDSFQFHPFFVFSSIDKKTLTRRIRTVHEADPNFEVALFINRIEWKNLSDLHARASKKTAKDNTT
jgi:hypothetical protein